MSNFQCGDLVTTQEPIRLIIHWSRKPPKELEKTLEANLPFLFLAHAPILLWFDDTLYQVPHEEAEKLDMAHPIRTSVG